MFNEESVELEKSDNEVGFSFNLFGVDGWKVAIDIVFKKGERNRVLTIDGRVMKTIDE